MNASHPVNGSEALKTMIRPALALFAALTIICGVLYPYLIAGVGQILFPWQANGSLILRDGKPVGSPLIGQAFSSPRHFWGRPSATSPMPNNAANSGGSNLGPSNPAQLDAVKNRIDALKAADPGNTLPIPIDLATASASGLDPEISLAAAYYQASRIARARGMTTSEVRSIINQYGQARYLDFLGEPRVNVLVLNLALDQRR